MRRFPLRPVPVAPTPPGIGLTLPPAVAPPSNDGPIPPTCPTVPPIADWTSVTNVFDCSALLPAGASLVDDVFIAAPGADLTAAYLWNIDLTGVTLPYMCKIVPEDVAVFVAQFRGMTAANMYISDFNTGAVDSYFFLMRPGDPNLGGAAQIATYQRHVPDDPANGLTATVRFRVLCIPIDPG